MKLSFLVSALLLDCLCRVGFVTHVERYSIFFIEWIEGVLVRARVFEAMDKIGAAAEADAFLAGLEKQAAAEQLKQQDVSSYGTWKVKQETNEYGGGGDYNGHALGYAA